jgi:hypothetical protein
VAERLSTGGYLAWLDPYPVFFAVRVRGSVIIFFAAFVVFGLVDPVLLLFCVVDVAGAMWAWAALRDDRSGTAT